MHLQKRKQVIKMIKFLVAMILYAWNLVMLKCIIFLESVICTSFRPKVCLHVSIKDRLRFETQTSKSEN